MPVTFGTRRRLVTLIFSPPADVQLARRARRREELVAVLHVAERTLVWVARAIARTTEDDGSDAVCVRACPVGIALLRGADQRDEARVGAAELQQDAEACSCLCGRGGAGRVVRRCGCGGAGGVVRRRGRGRVVGGFRIQIRRGKRAPRSRRARGRDVPALHVCRVRAGTRATTR
jgi:hypothetical protein